MDQKGRILVPGISEAVASVTDEELELYDKIDFDLEEYARDVGTETLLHDCKVLPGRCEACPHRAGSVPGPGAPGRRLRAGQTRAHPGHGSSQMVQVPEGTTRQAGSWELFITCQMSTVESSELGHVCREAGAFPHLRAGKSLYHPAQR